MMLAKASCWARGRPRTTAATRAPWKTSPAPKVLSTSTGWAGAYAVAPSAVRAHEPSAPAVATTVSQPSFSARAEAVDVVVLAVGAAESLDGGCVDADPFGLEPGDVVPRVDGEDLCAVQQA